jgi:GMP synthase-like glutamine amidotransferase
MPAIAIVNLHGAAPNTAIGALSSHIAATRADVEIFDACDGKFPRPRRFDAYIITSGPGFPNAKAPWRVRVQAAVTQWSASKPVFAIGLGFELMAAAYGWPVRPMTEPREGVFPLTPTPAGWSDPFMKDLEQATPVLENRHWAVLPPPAAVRSAAVVLAYSSAGDVAVARFNKYAVGTIFHPEASLEGAASTILARFLMAATDAA